MDGKRDTGLWGGNFTSLNETLFPSLTWEDKPLEVTIVPKGEKA